MNYALLTFAEADPTGASSFGGVPSGSRFEDHVEGLGGRILNEVVLASPDVATGVRPGCLVDGPLTAVSPALTTVLVITADDLDVAIAIARGHPAARGARVEIRPLA